MSQNDVATFAPLLGRAPSGLDKSRFNFGRVRPRLLIAALFLLLLVIAAIAPGRLVTGDPLATNPSHAFAAPAADHLLGTDENGRDVLTRLVYGVRPSLFIGLLAASITFTLGTLLGLTAGLGPRAIDGLAMRFAELLQSLPEILLALVIITFRGAGTENVLLALGIAGVPRCARQVRAQTHVVRAAPYVEAARSLGIPPVLVVLRHVLPNAVKPALAIIPIEIGWKIAAGATLSFLGLGAAPPAPEWGAMLSVGRDYILNAWWLTAIPALAITLTVLSVTALGRALVRRNEGRAL